MTKVALLVTDGCEECEALIQADLLRRAGIAVDLVSITGQKEIKSARQIRFLADQLIEDVDREEYDGVILPGGMKGTQNLGASARVCEILKRYDANPDKYIAAICAAPSILGHKGLLKGKKATCFPGFEKDLVGADACSGLVVIDGKFITGKGPGACIEFSLKLAEILVSADAALNIKAGMQCK